MEVWRREPRARDLVDPARGVLSDNRLARGIVGTSGIWGVISCKNHLRPSNWALVARQTGMNAVAFILPSGAGPCCHTALRMSMGGANLGPGTK